MQTKEISKSSLHYKIVSLVYYEYQIPDNHCGYVMSFLVSLFLTVGIFCIALCATVFGVLLPLGDFIGWALSGFSGEPEFWSVIIMTYAVVGIPAAAVFLVFGACAYVKNKLVRRIPARYEDPDYRESTFRSFYNAYKNKYCIKLKFIDDTRVD